MWNAPFLNSCHPSRDSLPSSGSSPKTSLTLINAVDKSRLLPLPFSLDLPLTDSPFLSLSCESDLTGVPSTFFFTLNEEPGLTLSRIASERAKKLNLFLLFLRA